MSACGIWSFVFGIGKSKLYKKEILAKNSELSNIFYNVQSTRSSIVDAGEVIMKLYSDNKKCEDLNSMRSFLFKKQLNKQKKVDSPSSSTATRHSLRVGQQAQEWLGYSLDPLKYGWQFTDGKLSPITTNLTIAPEYILHRIRN